MEHYGNLVTYMRLKNIVPQRANRPRQHSRKSNRTKNFTNSGVVLAFRFATAFESLVAAAASI
jgi:hypothetical protein